MASVTLVHHTHRLPIKYEYTYFGVIEAYDGVVTIQEEDRDWCRLMYIKGYQYTPDGRWLATQMDLEAEVARQLAETSKTNEATQDSVPSKPVKASTPKVIKAAPKTTEKLPVTVA